MRYRPLGHPAPLQHDRPGHLLPPPPAARLGQAPRPPRARLRARRQAAVLRQAAAAPAARGRGRRVHQHDALAADAHIAAPLRRLHRLPDEGARHVRARARRARAVHAADREHEGGVQGEEEADVPGEGAVRLILRRRVVPVGDA